MTIGPKSRNFNVSLKGNWSRFQSPNGTAWNLVSDGTAVNRLGILTVANPWRAVKPAGLNPTSRSLTRDSYKANEGEYRFKSGSLHDRFTGVINGPVVSLFNANYGVSERTRLTNEAVFDALKKLKDQKFNAGVAVAESEGVARLLVDAVSTTYETLEYLNQKKYLEAYRRFRRGVGRKYMSYRTWRVQYWNEIKHVKSVRRARRVPEGWLYYHYGLKPTVNDLANMTEDLAVRWRTNPELINGVVVGYAKNVIKQTSSYTIGDLWGTFQLTSFESIRIIMKVIPKNAFMAKLSSLGATNPAEALWNRTPFSFVVDYFFSVGDWLSALDSGVGWDFGDRVECYRRLRLGKMTPNSGRAGTYYMRVSPATVVRKVIDRKVNPTLYSPLAQVLPRLKLRNPSMTQIANLLSLAATGFKRTVRP